MALAYCRDEPVERGKQADVACARERVGAKSFVSLLTLPYLSTRGGHRGLERFSLSRSSWGGGDPRGGVLVVEAGG